MIIIVEILGALAVATIIGFGVAGFVKWINKGGTTCQSGTTTEAPAKTEPAADSR